MDNGTETESDDDDPESVESDGPHDVSNLYFTENIYLLHIISDFFFIFLPFILLNNISLICLILDFFLFHVF